MPINRLLKDSGLELEQVERLNRAVHLMRWRLCTSLIATIPSSI